MQVNSTSVCVWWIYKQIRTLSVQKQASKSINKKANNNGIKGYWNELNFLIKQIIDMPNTFSQSKTWSSRTWVWGSFTINLKFSFHSGFKLHIFIEVLFDGSLSPLSLSLTYGSDFPIRSIFNKFIARTTFTLSMPTGLFVAPLKLKASLIKRSCRQRD